MKASFFFLLAICRPLFAVDWSSLREQLDSETVPSDSELHSQIINYLSTDPAIPFDVHTPEALAIEQRIIRKAFELLIQHFRQLAALGRYDESLVALDSALRLGIKFANTDSDAVLVTGVMMIARVKEIFPVVWFTSS